MHGRVWLQTPHPVNAENAEDDVANRSMTLLCSTVYLFPKFHQIPNIVFKLTLFTNKQKNKRR